jgi:hypothetical protein
MLKWLVLPIAVFAYLAATVSAAPRDRDHDRLPDRWERNHQLSPRKASAKRDPDSDHLRNLREFRLRTHPRRADTDRDGLRDGAEVRRFRTNPRKGDTDGDGFSDRCELRKGTNPRKSRSRPKRRCSKSPKSLQPLTPAPQPSPSCTGYPEPRVYLEVQSWWDPQIGDPAHPGTGKMGHVHVEACVPLMAHYTGTEKINMDYTVRMHSLPGKLVYFESKLYGEDGTRTLEHNVWGTPAPVRCPTRDCAFQVRRTIDLSKAQYSGVHALVGSPLYYTDAQWEPDGTEHLFQPVPRWPIFLDNGKPAPPAGSRVAATAADFNAHGLFANSFYREAQNGSYATVGIKPQYQPYLFDPLRPKRISGVWHIAAFFEKTTAFAWVDPDLHGTPPSKGVVIHEGPGGNGVSGNSVKEFDLDSRQLADGWHRLLLGDCDVGIAAGFDPNHLDHGDHCGIQVLRFYVDNPP